jgi:hypothetical protein
VGGGGGHDDVDLRAVAAHLRVVERAHPAVGVARLVAVQLVGAGDRVAGERGVVGQVGRVEQARAGLHGAQDVGLVGAVDPRAHEAVRVVDPQAVVVAQHRVDAGGEQPQGGAARACLEVQVGVEHRVAPRLAVGVGAARRGAHQVAAQEQALHRPGVADGDADLQVAEQPQRRELVGGGEVLA